jgi:hypothetical protein
MTVSAALEVSPWRTWGNTANLELFANAADVTAQPQQLVNVTYDRPDTWSWFFAARMQGNAGAFFNLPGGNPTVQWDVTFGVGRSNMQIPSFHTMVFSAATLNTLNAQLVVTGNQSTGSNGINPGTDPSPLGDTVRVDIRDIPAESIQITATVFAPVLTGFLNVELTAYAAPRSHFRKEWLVEDQNPWNQVLQP